MSRATSRKRAWWGWPAQQAGQALSYVAILALATGLIAVFLEDKVREMDGLSAAVVSAGSDFLLRKMECNARTRLQAQRPRQQFPGAVGPGNERDAQSVPIADCPPGDAIDPGSDAGLEARPDPWDVTVVLFGDADLDALELPYPVPYQIHAEVLETLLAYRPAAIFVDFMFLQERESEKIGAQLLQEVLVRAREANIPIVMALPDSDLVNDKDSLQRRKKAWLVDRFTGCADFAALTPIKLHDPLGLIRYPAHSEVGLRIEPAPVSLLRRLWDGPKPLPIEASAETSAADLYRMDLASPAFAVVDALARSQSAAGVAPSVGAVPAPALEAVPVSNAAVRCLDRMPSAPVAADQPLRHRPEMEILWRTGVNERRTTVDGCGREAPTTGTFVERLRRKLKSIARPLTVLSAGYSPEFCPVQPVVSARALLAGDLDETGRRARFSGRVIAYGANFLGALDAVKTPAGEHTPSVFVHAMAIHNLLLLGEEGYKVNERLRRWIFIALVALAAAALAVFEHNQDRLRRTSDARTVHLATTALGAPGLKSWFQSLAWIQRTEAVGAVVAFLVFLFALYWFNRIVTVALVVSVVLLWKMNLHMLGAHVTFLVVSTGFSFVFLRLGSLSILLVLGLLFVARKLDAWVRRFGDWLDEARKRGGELERILTQSQSQSQSQSPGPSGKSDRKSRRYRLARAVFWLDQRRKATFGPPGADPPSASPTKEHCR